MFTYYILYVHLHLWHYVCLICLLLLGCIDTWPGHTAGSPSVPSDPLQSVMAETGSLDTAAALSLQRAGGTLPCWTWAGDKIKNILHWNVKSTDTKCFSWWAKLAGFITVLAQTHYTGQKVSSHILSHVAVADICLYSINEESQCLCATTWTTLAVFSGSVSSGKSGSISATPSPSSIVCSSSGTWQRATEQPQAPCQLQPINCRKQAWIL